MNNYDDILKIWKTDFINKIITKKKNNILIYKEILNLLKEFFYMNKKVANIWSLDVFMMFYKKNFIGFTGTPLINTILVHKYKYDYENYRQISDESTYIVDSKKYSELNYIYNIKYNLINITKNVQTDEKILEYINTNSCDCIIDICGIFKNHDSLELSKLLLSNNQHLDFIIYIDFNNNNKILFRNHNIIDYDYKLLYLNTGKYIIYFDNRNIRGTDIEHQKEGNKFAITKCIVIVGYEKDYNLIQQSIGRCRYFYNVYFIF